MANQPEASVLRITHLTFSCLKTFFITVFIVLDFVVITGVNLVGTGGVVCYFRQMMGLFR